MQNLNSDQDFTSSRKKDAPTVAKENGIERGEDRTRHNVAAAFLVPAPIFVK